MPIMGRSLTRQAYVAVRTGVQLPPDARDTAAMHARRRRRLVMRTILMCYEERPVAPRVLEHTAEIAKAFGAKVIVTSVAPVLSGMAARGISGIDPTDDPERHRAETVEARERLLELGVADIETVTGLGDTASTILELAEQRSVDLIVVGAHDGGAFSRFLEGSPGDTIAHKAHADVLVVH
jgi:nucleotide-binding universal stress UspA family protein